MLWENIFLVWVTSFPVKEGLKVCRERGHNLETEGREVADLFRDTAFHPEWDWKISNEHLRKMIEHWKFRKLFQQNTLIFPWQITNEKTKLSYCDSFSMKCEPFSFQKNIFPHRVKKIFKLFRKMLQYSQSFLRAVHLQIQSTIFS